MLRLSQKENVLQWKDSKFENNISIYIAQHVTYVLNLLCSFFSIYIFGVLYCFSNLYHQNSRILILCWSCNSLTFPNLLLRQFNSRRKIKCVACVHIPFVATHMYKMYTINEFHLNKILTIRCLTYHVNPPLQLYSQPILKF